MASPRSSFGLAAEEVVTFCTVTFGCTAAHFKGYAHGGLRRQLPENMRLRFERYAELNAWPKNGDGSKPGGNVFVSRTSSISDESGGLSEAAISAAANVAGLNSSVANDMVRRYSTEFSATDLPPSGHGDVTGNEVSATHANNERGDKAGRGLSGQLQQTKTGDASSSMASLELETAGSTASFKSANGTASSPAAAAAAAAAASKSANAALAATALQRGGFLAESIGGGRPESVGHSINESKVKEAIADAEVAVASAIDDYDILERGSHVGADLDVDEDGEGASANELMRQRFAARYNDIELFPSF